MAFANGFEVIEGLNKAGAETLNLKKHASCALVAVSIFLSGPIGCSRGGAKKIAVIPRTSGTMMWEPEHGGALAAGLTYGAHIYWNAPTREDDVQGQIAMVQKVAAGNFHGLVLAPDHSLELITPIRRAVARGLPTVVIGSPLGIPPDGSLAYVLNDEPKGGAIAAERVAKILNGKGSIAVMGIDPDIAGIATRCQSFERSLAQSYPDIHVVIKKAGSFNVPHEQQVAEEILKTYPRVEVIVALTATATRGAMSVLSDTKSKNVRVIGFDPDSLTFESVNLDSLILENTYEMGEEAVRLIVQSWRGRPMPRLTMLEPLLVTRENFRTEQVWKMTTMTWQPESVRWKWTIGP